MMRLRFSFPAPQASLLLSLLLPLTQLALPSFATGSDLANAIERKDRQAIERLLADCNEVVVNQSQEDGMTPLHWAVQHSDFDLTCGLLDRGAQHSPKNRYGVVPLAIACINGHEGIVDRLLDAGADANSTSHQGETVLMTASRTGRLPLVESLIRHGADTNRKEDQGQTALMWAAAEGHATVVQRLLENGVDPTERLDSGFDAFLFAVREGQIEVVEALLKAGMDPNPAIETTSKNGRYPKNGSGPLSVAVENGHFELALRLVRAGADPNDQRSGFAPLHILTWVRKPNRGDDLSGLPPPDGSGNLNSLDFARQLIAEGADVNLRLKQGKAARGRNNLKGATPLFMSADTADLAYMKVLVELGANPLLANVEGSTPLMVACGLGTNAPAEEAGTEDESIAAVEFLLEHGADLDTVDQNLETAMHGAAYKNFPKMVEFLDERGADIAIWNKTNAMKRTPLKIAEGYRPGNFRPSPETIAAIQRVMIRHGLTPPAPTIREQEESDDEYSRVNNSKKK